MNLVAAMLLANACAFGGVLDNAWTKGTTDKNPLSCKPDEADAWARYVPEFNRYDEELYTNAIPNSAAEAFLRENAPSFTGPDKDIERTYHFRWWTYRKHIKGDFMGTARNLSRRRYAVVLTTRCGDYSRAKRDRFKAIAALTRWQ